MALHTASDRRRLACGGPDNKNSFARTRNVQTKITSVQREDGTITTMLSESLSAACEGLRCVVSCLKNQSTAATQHLCYMYVCMYVCMHVCIYACMHVCSISVSICLCIYMFYVPMERLTEIIYAVM